MTMTRTFENVSTPRIAISTRAVWEPFPIADALRKCECLDGKAEDNMSISGYSLFTIYQIERILARRPLQGVKFCRQIVKEDSKTSPWRRDRLRRGEIRCLLRLPTNDCWY